MYEYTLTAAAVTGGLWWPIGEPAYKPGGSLSWSKGAQPRGTYHANDAAFVNPDSVTLREAVEALLDREGGDFSTAPLLAEPMLTVRKVGRTRTIVRTFALDNARTIADYVDREWAGFPFEE